MNHHGLKRDGGTYLITTIILWLLSLQVVLITKFISLECIYTMWGRTTTNTIPSSPPPPPPTPFLNVVRGNIRLIIPSNFELSMKTKSIPKCLQTCQLFKFNSPGMHLLRRISATIILQSNTMDFGVVTVKPPTRHGSLRAIFYVSRIITDIYTLH